MRADDHVDAAFLQALDDPFLFAGRAEATQDFDIERILRKSLAECAIVLFGEHCRRHEHRDLHSIVDRFEGSTNGDLGLAVADVAAEQSIHRTGSFQIVLDFGNGRELVGRFLIGKARFELLLPVGIRRDWRAGLAFAHRLHVNHIRREIANRFFHLANAFAPRGATELREFWIALAAAHVFLHEIDFGNRHVEHDTIAKFEEQVLFFGCVV